jgi:alpha-N-arabinofuranosidase
MSIPEFILRKLVLPGSFKRSNTGFSFKLRNTFAPGTITRFEMYIGGTQIPGDQISFTEDGSPEINASEVSTTSPLFFSMNKDVTISAKCILPTGLINVKVLTKEIGEIEFTLVEPASKKKVRGFSPFVLSYFRSKLKSKIKIQTQSKIGTAPPYLLGQFVEHLEKCVYDGIWTSDGSALRQDTLDLIKQLNPPMIRYPGGNFASGYHWEDGIGPKQNRPHRHDAAWQAEEINQVGTDEFLAFCEEIGTEPFFVVNDGSGTPEEAASWVSYCNDPSTTPQGTKRAQNGHTAPYGVKYWGIGNEVWGAWQIGTTNSTDYVKRLLKFILEMKKVDPTIKIIAVGNHPLTDSVEDPAYIWNMEVLTKAGDQIDFLSWHIYQPEKDGWNESSDPHELYNSITAAPLALETYIQRIQQQIDDFSPNRAIKQALDEWNVWLPPAEVESSMHHVTYTMRDALYVASTLAVLYRHSKSVEIANLAQLVNVLPLIQTNSKTAIATAIFYPFMLFSQMESTVIKCAVDAATYSNQALGQNIAAMQNVSYLDVVTSMSNDKTRITSILINRHPERRMSVSLDFDDDIDFTPNSAMQICSTHPIASNSFTKPHRVKITDAKLPQKKEGVWVVELPPCSVTLLEYKQK